jgi:hypothetical protein
MNKEDSDYLICEDPALEEALRVDLAEYEGEIFLWENNICWCEDATYVALFEDELEAYGIFFEE